MSDAPDNIFLVYLRRLDEKLDRVIQIQGDHGSRLTRLELGLAGVRRDQAQDAERVAHVEARIDQVFERLDRIDKRLGLIEA